VLDDVVRVSLAAAVIPRGNGNSHAAGIGNDRMGDIAVENYKKSVAKIFDKYGQKIGSIGKQLAPVEVELQKLEKIKTPSPDDKKKIAELTKKREALHKEADTAGLELKVELMIIQLPPTADEKELIKLPDWMKEIIKKKGIPLGKVSIAPDVSFDFKAKKLKYVGITIRW
jgi:hypothetical protein